MRAYLLTIETISYIRIDTLIVSPLLYNEVQEVLQEKFLHVEGERSRQCKEICFEDIWKCSPDMVCFISKQRRVTVYVKGGKEVC